jgi:RNA polymerase sigma factor (TIGR02999 family)
MAPELSDLIRRADGADPAAAGELFAVLYEELRRLADRHLRKVDSLTLTTTSLVHETYLSMVDRSGAQFPDRARFFAYASRAMRGLVIDYARRRAAKKRDRGFEITLNDKVQARPDLDSYADLEGLGEALDDLASLSPGLAEIVDLHFFGGFSFAEIGELRGVSERTVYRDWRKARLLLHRWLTDPPEPDPTDSSPSS